LFSLILLSDFINIIESKIISCHKKLVFLFLLQWFEILHKLLSLTMKTLVLHHFRYNNLNSYFFPTGQRGFINKSYWIGLNNLEDSSSFSFIGNGMSDWGLQKYFDKASSGSCAAFTSYLHLSTFRLRTHDCGSYNYYICKLPDQCL
jgi:hypothetical protein